MDTMTEVRARSCTPASTQRGRIDGSMMASRTRLLRAKASRPGLTESAESCWSDPNLGAVMGKVHRPQ